jgi:hypothetical protein
MQSERAGWSADAPLTAPAGLCRRSLHPWRQAGRRFLRAEPSQLPPVSSLHNLATADDVAVDRKPSDIQSVMEAAPRGALRQRFVVRGFSRVFWQGPSAHGFLGFL